MLVVGDNAPAEDGVVSGAACSWLRARLNLLIFARPREEESHFSAAATRRATGSKCCHYAQSASGVLCSIFFGIVLAPNFPSGDLQMGWAQIMATGIAASEVHCQEMVAWPT